MSTGTEKPLRKHPDGPPVKALQEFASKNFSRQFVCQMFPKVHVVPWKFTRVLLLFFRSRFLQSEQLVKACQTWNCKWLPRRHDCFSVISHAITRHGGGGLIECLQWEEEENKQTKISSKVRLKWPTLWKLRTSENNFLFAFFCLVCSRRSSKGKFHTGCHRPARSCHGFFAAIASTSLKSVRLMKKPSVERQWRRRARRVRPHAIL